MQYNITSIIAWLTLGIIWGSNVIFMKWKKNGAGGNAITYRGVS